jgi:hypothetical protein
MSREADDQRYRNANEQEDFSAVHGCEFSRLKNSRLLSTY